jgi:hypothetical protein
MSLNGGLGDVDSNRKGILLDSLLSEKMISVSGNNCDVWLLVHRFDSAIFKAYNINSSGINTTPVLSNVGMNCKIDPINKDGYVSGVMKCSPYRDKIILCNVGSQNNSFAELFSFDFTNGTILGSIGVIRNIVHLFNNYDTIGIYGACFSPDNSKLYLAAVDSFIQYDVSTNNIITISNSKFILNVNPHSYSDMKLLKE